MKINHAKEVLTIIRADGDLDAVVLRIKDTGDTDTDYSIANPLGRVPVGCQIILSDRAVIAYKGTRWTNDTIDIKFNAANADINLRIW